MAARTPDANWRLVGGVLGDVAHGEIDHIADQQFAFVLSILIAQTALAYAIAFFFCYVFLIALALRAARRELARASDERGFASRFSEISERIERNGLVGDAWREFRETAVTKEQVIDNTIRPQFFINFADARERLFGLKMMMAVPSFFIGVGLLLTLVGLVIAVNKAAGPASVVKADEITASFATLLKSATVQFSTSIAGLGAALVLWFWLRSCQSWIEGAYARLCHTTEVLMRFQPSQRVALELLKILAEQKDQLKEINSKRFFSEFGDTLAPRLEVAFNSTLQPTIERLVEAIAHIETKSQEGFERLLQQSVPGLSGGAGIDLTQIARTLEDTQRSLTEAQINLAGSAAEIQQRVAEATDKMLRAVEQGEARLGSCTGSAANAAEAVMMADVKPEPQTSAIDARTSGLLGALRARAAGTGRRAQRPPAAAARRAMDEVALMSIPITPEALETMPRLRHWLDLYRFGSSREWWF
jgi:hypothetical protein